MCRIDGPLLQIHLFLQVLLWWFLSTVSKHFGLWFHTVQSNTDNFIQ